MKLKPYVFALILFTAAAAQAVPLALTFEQARSRGINSYYLDSIYVSAFNVPEPQKALFQNEAEMNMWIEDYTQLLQNMMDFLKSNGFDWYDPTRTFNRIYFNEEGGIDYFFYQFKNIIPVQQQIHFHLLLNAFIKDYKVTSYKTKFVQCGPSTYMTKEQKALIAKGELCIIPRF